MITKETYERLVPFKPMIKQYFEVYTVSDHNQLIQLNNTLFETTGNAFNMDCSACKADMLRFTRNLIEQWEQSADHVNTRPKNSKQK